MYRYDTNAPAPTIENQTVYYQERIKGIRAAMATTGTTFAPEQLTKQLADLAEELADAEYELATLIGE